MALNSKLLFPVKPEAPARLFEAAACGAPILSDHWPGLGDFFAFDREICIATSTREAHAILCEVDDETRRQIGLAARAKVLGHHTAAHRAAELEQYLKGS
jgi:spore maturation protein CgeB